MPPPLAREAGTHGVVTPDRQHQEPVCVFRVGPGEVFEVLSAGMFSPMQHSASETVTCSRLRLSRLSAGHKRRKVYRLIVKVRNTAEIDEVTLLP